MENFSLNNTQSRTKIFQQGVLDNLQYWQDWLEANLTLITAVDYERDNIVRAISFALELEEMTWSSIRNLIEAFSAYMERRGHWEAWNRVLNDAVEAAHRSNDVAGGVLLSALLARLLQLQSRSRQAVVCYHQTIRMARRIDDSYNEARTCSNLGFLYSEQGYWWRAEVLCCHALAIFEQLDSKHGQAHTENHLGSLYTRQGRWKFARRHFERACALWASMGDEHGLMRGLNNLGTLCNEIDRPDEALSYLERALHYATSTGEEAEIAKIYENMGVAYRLKDEPNQAENYARRAETIFRRDSNLMGLAEIWGNLGVACLDQGKFQEAASHLQASLQAWRTLKNHRGEIKTLLQWVEYELDRKEQRRAAKRLAQVESLLNQYDPGKQNYDLQSQLLKYRTILSD
jgi:tetratricopeptide (TPR) repeat protein